MVELFSPRWGGGGFVNVNVKVNERLEAGTGRLGEASVPLGFVNVNVKESWEFEAEGER